MHVLDSAGLRHFKKAIILHSVQASEPEGEVHIIYKSSALSILKQERVITCIFGFGLPYTLDTFSTSSYLYYVTFIVAVPAFCVKICIYIKYVCDTHTHTHKEHLCIPVRTVSSRFSFVFKKSFFWASLSP